MITFKQWYKAMTTRGSGMTGTERWKMQCAWNAAIFQSATREAELRAEIAAKDAEIERLRAENRRLKEEVKDYLLMDDLNGFYDAIKPQY